MRKILRVLSIATFLFLTSIVVRAQEYMGYISGNYAGVTSLNLNPAGIVDSRYKVDIALTGFNVYTGSNYIGIDRRAIFNRDLFNDPNFSENYLSRLSGKKAYNGYVNASIQLPSALITLTKNDAIAISGRIRSVTNANGFEQPFMDLVWESLNYPVNWNRQFTNKRVEAVTNTWAEYGISYGRVLFNNGPHFLKGGVTVKLLQGLGSGYMFATDVSYNFLNADTVSIFNAQVNYGHSNNLLFDTDQPFRYRFEADPSVGADIGFEYEWRPKYKDYQYDMDGKTGLWRRDQNKYKLKIGVSVTDIGGIRYRKSSSSRNFTANVNNLPVSAFNNIKDVQTFDSTLNSLFTLSQDKGDYTLWLPTALSFQVDYNIWKGLYLNFTPVISLTPGIHNRNKNRVWNNYALTPRYEFKWFGVYLPNSYNTLSGFNSGISLRLGPVVIGSGTIFSSLGKKAVREADIHVLLKIPIMYNKPRDRDNDKVSDKLDKCRDVAGVWAFRGCPDTDGDGVQDSEDECPKEPGLKELRGCPDRDMDGIIDSKDDCPDDKGLAEFNGCPDTDGDKVIDKLDKCPTLPGPPEKFGCPDRDNDGITDDKDECPDEPGLPENNGCPFRDTDGDGIKDIDDKCPTQAGPLENGGCPYADSDGDGIIDLEDKCPKTPGVKENFGCPAIAVEEQAVIKEAFDNLEFATGKAIIRTTSYASLDKLAELLKNKKEYMLLIEGHTDNVGKRESNLTLSKNRANAVKTYLMKKGVSESKLKTLWYGPDKPIADNSTDEGRQKNRRVEMTIVFE